MPVVSDLLTSVFERRPRLTGSAKDDGRPMDALIDALVGTAGEASGQMLARIILDRYASLTDEEKLSFFRHLVEAMTINPDEVREAVDQYQQDPSRSSYQRLKASVRPARVELIGRLNKVPEGTSRLVAMRRDLLRLVKKDQSLAELDLDFKQLFGAWFNRGFLVLRPITWDSPAKILEKIIAYEAVHAIDTWDELRRRIQPKDRRCFAFFHPAMADEPLIFVEVALTKGVPGSIQTLLSEDRLELDDDQANTAVFYSISNCQAGLASISFGNSLIKQVAADLARELPGLRTFVTLSPIPGFTAWLRDARISPDDDQLRSLAAHYLLNVKSDKGGPLDPVARFHLGNGAQVHKLHADADTSDKGIDQSCGVMVNYLYNLGKVARNHERFAVQGKIAASSEVKALSETGRKLLTSNTAETLG